MGKAGMKDSWKQIRWAPWEAASSISWRTLSVVAAGFRKTEEAWQAATFTVGKEVNMGI